MDGVVSPAALHAAEGSFASHGITRRILVIFNPAAGHNSRPRFDQVIAILKETGCAVAVMETNAPGHAEALASTATNVDVIAAAGGDGTINEVVNGLAKNSYARDIAIGLIPLGTANVLADEIGLSRAPERIAQTLRQGVVRPIYVGRVNGRRFVMMAGAGFDADVVHGVSLALKKRLGVLAYVWQAAYQAFKDTFAARDAKAGCEILIDGVAHLAASAVACNGRRYGGPFIAAPAAALTDDRFQVVLMAGRGWLKTARYSLALMLGRIGNLADVRIIAGREIDIRGTPGAPVQADGDIVAFLPVRIEVDPDPVKLVFPA